MKINLIDSNLKKKHLDLVSPKKFFKHKKKICELCNGSNLQTIQSIGRIGAPLEYGVLKTVICKQCSHKFLNPIYEDKFYQTYYRKKYRKVAFGDMTPSKKYLFYQKKRGEGIYSFFKNKIKTKSNFFLDHGCASGLTMLPWKKEWNCHGIDPHLPSVIHGKKKYKLNIKCAYGEKLPFKENFFDTILSLGSLEHSYDINKSMKEIVRTLKNNSYLIIRWRSNKLIGSPLEYYNHNHYRFFSKKTWNLLLTKYGFQSIKNFNENIEGYESYSYILAKLKKDKSKAKQQPIINIDKKVYLKEIKKYNNYLISYYRKCVKLKNMLLKKDTFKKRKEFIKQNKVFLLNIGESSAVNRFCNEALSFLNHVKIVNK